MPVTFKLSVLQYVFAICRLAAQDAVPLWAESSSFFSITRTDDELAIVCQAEQVPSHVRAEHGWRGLKVEGPLDFALTGVLAVLAKVLAEAGVSIFAISTFDTDYILVKDEKLAAAMAALAAAGHRVN